MNNPLRNRNDTKQKLIEAVGETIAKSGFSKTGVNAIARQAGVNKKLIYRYFDGLEGLYQAYAESANFWPPIKEILGTEEQLQQLRKQPFAQIMKIVFQRYIDAIRQRPITIEILAWETVQRNALTIELENVREKTSLALFAELEKIDVPKADWQAIVNIFSSALHYLLIRGRKVRYFTGMDLQSDASWRRLLDSIEHICHAIELTSNNNNRV